MAIDGDEAGITTWLDLSDETAEAGTTTGDLHEVGTVTVLGTLDYLIGDGDLILTTYSQNEVLEPWLALTTAKAKKRHTINDLFIEK
jgi:hypothetical protein